MNYQWYEEILWSSNGSYRALIQNKKEIANVSCLDKAFVNKLIETHNKAICEVMGASMREGVKIAKEYD